MVVRNRRPDAQSGASRPPELLNGITNVSDTKQLSHYIDGQWVAGAPASDSLNPSDTRDIVAKVPGGDKIDGKCRRRRGEGRVSGVGQRQPRSALGPARQGRARPSWRARTNSAACCRARKARPCPKARAKSCAPARIFKFFAGEALRRHGVTVDSTRPGVAVETYREPLGVFGLITPVEFPDRNSGMEERAGAGVRQHRGHEARLADAGHGACADGNHPRSRFPEGRVQPDPRRRLDGRRARRASRRRGHFVHRRPEHGCAASPRPRCRTTRACSSRWAARIRWWCSMTAISIAPCSARSMAPSSPPASAARRRAASSSRRTSTTSSSKRSPRASRR